MTILEKTSIIQSLCAITALLISVYTFHVTKKNSKEIKKIKEIKINNGPNFKYCSSVGNQGDGFRITQNQK